ncbi:MAG: hypothetical protein ACI92E_001890 [Oceanicoccus sp.]|jgi:hypothetical protein
MLRLVVNGTFMNGMRAARPMLTQNLSRAGQVAGITSTGIGAYQLHSDWDKYKTPGDKGRAAFAFGLGAAANLGGAGGLISPLKSFGLGTASSAAGLLAAFASNDYEFVRTEEQSTAWFQGVMKLAPSAISLVSQPLGATLAVACSAHDVSGSNAPGDFCSLIATLEPESFNGIEFLVMP